MKISWTFCRKQKKPSTDYDNKYLAFGKKGKRKSIANYEKYGFEHKRCNKFVSTPFGIKLNSGKAAGGAQF